MTEMNISQKETNSQTSSNILTQEFNLDFIPLGISENRAGNYDNYLRTSIYHIMKMKKMLREFQTPLENENTFKIFKAKNYSKDKKILLLDLDETLIHADFNEEFANDENIKYDAVISFYSEEKPSNDLKDDDDQSTISDDDSKDYSYERKLNTVGIFLRPGVKLFLEEVSKYFEVGIFTASVPEYADAVINYLDPDNKFIKFRLYRNNCINVGDLLRVKNLKILKNIPLNKIILVDNNMYSFTPQLNNGILINSFFNDKNDNELSNVLSYLINYIIPCNDVRKVNEEFFGFQKIVDDMISNVF
jgi:Dullard-like phosphatase family protein